jgi:hypothetical protein
MAFASTAFLMVIFLVLTGGFVTHMFGIYHAQTSGDDSMYKAYIIPASLINVIYVTVIMILLMTGQGISPSYKIIASLIIFSGTIMEIYMTQLGDTSPYTYVDYVFSPIAYLTRLYYILDLLPVMFALLTPTPTTIIQAAGKRR